MFTVYTPDEIQELLVAGSKSKKAIQASQEEKLFHSIKHVRLFDNIEMEHVLKIVSDVKLNRYNSGDEIDMSGVEAHRIHYVIAGTVTLPISDGEVELGKDQTFGEVGAFTKTYQKKIIKVTEDNTMIFSFIINKAGLSRETAESFVKFYDSLLTHTVNKLLWFDML